VQDQTAARFIASRGITSSACSVYCAAYYLEALYDGGQAQAGAEHADRSRTPATGT